MEFVHRECNTEAECIQQCQEENFPSDRILNVEHTYKHRKELRAILNKLDSELDPTRIESYDICEKITKLSTGEIMLLFNIDKTTSPQYVNMYLLYLFGHRSDGSDDGSYEISNENRIALAIPSNRKKGSSYKCHSDVINAHIGELSHVLDIFDKRGETYQTCIKNKTVSMHERKAREGIRSQIRSSRIAFQDKLSARKQSARNNPFSKGKYSYKSQKRSPNKVSPTMGGTRRKRKHRKTRKAKR